MHKRPRKQRTAWGRRIGMVALLVGATTLPGCYYLCYCTVMLMHASAEPFREGERYAYVDIEDPFYADSRKGTARLKVDAFLVAWPGGGLALVRPTPTCDYVPDTIGGYRAFPEDWPRVLAVVTTGTPVHGTAGGSSYFIDSEHANDQYVSVTLLTRESNSLEVRLVGFEIDWKSQKLNPTYFQKAK